jgi:hypothetical protein
MRIESSGSQPLPQAAQTENGSLGSHMSYTMGGTSGVWPQVCQADD